MEREVFTTDNRFRFEAEIAKNTLTGGYAIDHPWANTADKTVTEKTNEETWFIDFESLTIVKLLPN